MIRYIYLLLFLIVHNFSFSQNERDIARDGNKNYEKGLFADSEVDYRKSLSENKSFEEAQFNLSDALFKQERYDESIDVLNNLINTTQKPDLKADSYYNLGNNFLQQQKLPEAIDAYKDCLRINSSDEEARYNLSKAMSILENQNQQQENDKKEDDSEQNEDQKDQNSGETDSPEDNEDQKEEDSDNQNNKSDPNDNEQNQDSQDNLSNEDLSKQEMERILDALERQEEKVQEEVKKMKAKSSNKKVEKDW
ncbi:MAG: hypothetical protein CMP54_03150 [Flavobacteriales bacterium]|nr:hypothetical protein [Flavobacteriales bacterium]